MQIRHRAFLTLLLMFAGVVVCPVPTAAQDPVPAGSEERSARRRTAGESGHSASNPTLNAAPPGVPALW